MGVAHKGGLINTLLPEPKVPSHQGPDARTVIPDLDVITIAALGPFNLAHTHFAIVEAPGEVDRDEVLDAFRRAPRIAFIRASNGVEAPNSVIEIIRDLGRPRADLWEVAALLVAGRIVLVSARAQRRAPRS